MHQTYRGVALADRLPQIAALFEAGLISDQLVRTIVYRTALITDPEAMAAVDAELADFVRCRDLTCRWPGCDKPAYGCDLDHTVPYPVGPTHASNLKCLCRFQQWSKASALVSWRQSSAGSWSSSYVAELGPPSIGSPLTKADSLRRKLSEPSWIS